MRSKKDPGPFPERRPFNLDAKVYGDFMEKYYRWWLKTGWTLAGSAEEFYGFNCDQVADIHFHKQGEGNGIWFRLHDGRVFDVLAHPDDPDPVWYDKATH